MQNPAARNAASVAGSLPPGASGDGGVHGAIAHAADETGVDFGYLLAQARLESGLDPRARARTSSATGLYQFTGQTWLTTLARHGAEHGLDWAGQAVGNAASDPGLRTQLLALRNDPRLSALMAGELANDNRAALQTVLGRDPDHAELYLAHFLGADGATRFLTGLGANPDASAAALLPKAAAANRPIFYDSTGAPRSLAGVMSLLRDRLEAAATGSSLPSLHGDWALANLPYGDPSALDGPWATLPSGAPELGAGSASYTGKTFTGSPVAQAFQEAAFDAGAAQPTAAQGRTSMADTLRETFALGGGSSLAGAGSEHVRQAYGRLKAMGL
ncbi:lytic transglycosylase domain-containing protein [Novosphingobium pituita]|uniref:Lytic transglycosylase domain-containing protein n=1 Tax=Novosphingobium pituita TaxID=3056842 RepID=A0ABQ6P986_9SPHN|nr:lytic transglycosylase domain-containing protein [Novosphingobium sp. IK01]GMM61783.1 hypothetical protein NUTIK01_25600 [Novosphingobium sp. IK01]